MLVGLSFAWDCERLILATPAHTKTARNLAQAAVARVALGPTRDVVIIDGRVEVRAAATAPEVAFIKRTGWDPGQEERQHVYIYVAPVTIQAWRELNEIAGRHIMRDGSWLA